MKVDKRYLHMRQMSDSVAVFVTKTMFIILIVICIYIYIYIYIYTRSVRKVSDLFFYANT